MRQSLRNSDERGTLSAERQRWIFGILFIVQRSQFSAFLLV
jgi:hypothetical protein